MSNTLVHYGILGMKWGVHRRRRAAAINTRDAISLRKAGFKEEADALDLLAKKQNAKADEIEDKINKKKERKKNVKEMSDDELRRTVNRLQLEQQYSQLSSSNVRKGREYVQKIIKAGTAVTAVTTTALTLYNNANKIKSIIEGKNG